MKSPDPAGSDLARNGANAPPASGNAGARSDIGPTSRTTRLMIPRAGRPVKTLVSTVSLSLATRNASRWAAGKFGFRAKQIGSSDLHGGSAEREGRHDATRVGNAASSDDRYLHRIDDLRHERHRADLGCDIVGQEHAAVAACLVALRDDGVAAFGLQP